MFKMFFDICQKTFETYKRIIDIMIFLECWPVLSTLACNGPGSGLCLTMEAISGESRYVSLIHYMIML